MRISIEHCRWTNHFIKPPGQAGNSFRGNKPVHSKQDQSWVFFGRFDARAETPILWPPHVKSWLSGKDSDAGRDWGQEEKGTTEDEMAGWHHWLDGHDFGWTPGVGDGQGGLVCCNSWGRKESDTTERMNWTELNWILVMVNIYQVQMDSQLCCQWFLYIILYLTLTMVRWLKFNHLIQKTGRHRGLKKPAQGHRTTKRPG